MYKLFCTASLLALMCFTAACGSHSEDIIPEFSADSTALESEAAKSDTEPYYETSEQSDAREENILSIEITVGDKTFLAKLYDNAAAEKFSEMLPLTLDMSELNGNEKYFYLSENLPMAAESPDKINSGDIMLYGSSCLVLFYDSFSTPYSYTKIGYIKDASGLADALGDGGVEVKFEKAG